MRGSRLEHLSILSSYSTQCRAVGPTRTPLACVRALLVASPLPLTHSAHSTVRNQPIPRALRHAVSCQHTVHALASSLRLLSARSAPAGMSSVTIPSPLGTHTRAAPDTSHQGVSTALASRQLPLCIAPAASRALSAPSAVALLIRRQSIQHLPLFSPPRAGR